MSKADVIDALGAPDTEVGDGSWWYYERYGLMVAFGVDEPVVLELFGGETPTGEVALQFRATTAEGIGLGSSRVNVIQTFGLPEFDETDPLGDEHIEYSTRFYVRIREGKVAQVKVGPPRHVERRKPAA
jgi:hypothetical protein